MIDTLRDTIILLGRSPELLFILKATVAIMFGLTATWLARNAAASVRHFLLALTLNALMVFPPLLLVVPAFTIHIPISNRENSVAAQVPSKQGSNRIEPIPAIIDGWAAEPAKLSLPDWRTILRALWVIGVLLILASLGIALGRLSRIRRNGVPWLEREPLVQSLAQEVGVQRSVTLLVNEDLNAPLAFGSIRPTIILPVDSPSWSEADLRRALVHELEHLRRNDWLMQLIGRVTCSIYWFHPLIWITWRRLRLEAERACDDAVLRQAEHTEYAEQLVNLARRLSINPERSALAMANRSDLSTRISAILDNTQRRGPMQLRIATTAVVGAAVVLFALVPIRAAGISPGVALMIEDEQSSKAQRSRKSSALDRALLEAAEEGDRTGISELIAAGADVNCAIDGDGSPLIVAAREGQLVAVRLLLEQGADPNMGVSGDGNPLIMAAREGHTEIVELLLDRGANIDQVVPGDENALIQASGEGQLTTIKLLVARGADVNVRVRVDEVFGRRGGEWRTPLSMARKGGHREVVTYLLSIGAKE